MATAADTDTPRTAQGMLPTSMSTASAGMASSILPTQQNLSQLMYQRYYPAVYYVGYMQQAVNAAEANPYVDSANALLAEAQGLQARSDARRAELVAAARSAQAARAKLNAARLKAAGRGGGFNAKLFLDSIKTMGTIGGKLGELEEGRLTKSGVEEKVARLKAYGTEQGITSGALGAMGSAASIAGRDAGPGGMTEAQLDLIAQSDVQGAGAIRAARQSTSDLERGNHAFMFARELERQGVDTSRAEQFAADTFRVPPRMASEEGKQYIQSQMARDAQALIPAGEGEAELVKAEAMLNEFQRYMLNQMGKGRGGAVQAELKRQQVGQLTPQEDADLRLYLAALANDGIITPEGEDVMSGGRRVTLSADDIARGKDAYEKAKKHGTYRAEDAAYFDDEFLLTYKEGIDRSELAKQKRLEAMTRAERTVEEVQREAAENFVRTATAIRDLEDYVPLDAAGVNSNFDATVIGGATHIARREGSGVFDLGAHHPDRKRRLGGVGPIAQAPLRTAQQLFMRSGDRNQPMPPADLQQAVQALRDKYKRNPEKLEKAVQYLFAMQVVSMKAQQAGRDVPAVERADDRPPAPPPGSQHDPTRTLPEDFDTPRTGGGQRAATGAGASRAASSPVLTATPEEADLFLQGLSTPPPTLGGTELLYRPELAYQTAQASLAEQPASAPAPGAAPAPQAITTNNGNRQPAKVQPAVAADDPRRFIPGALPLSAYGPTASTNPTVVDEIRALYEADQRGEAILPPELDQFIFNRDRR